MAQRLREEIDAGRRPGDIVVLVRATASLRLFEQALEDQGLPTYVVGGRGYWSQEQVRDATAYLAALANPRDESAFYAVLASPFCGASATRWPCSPRPGARTAAGRGPRCAGRGGRRRVARRPRRDRPRAAARVRAAVRRRARAGRAPPVETLLERAIVAHRLRPRDPRPRGRGAAAREPAQADAPGARLRALRGPRPARVPRLRGHPGPRRGARGRGRAGVRGRWTRCG